MHEVGKDTVTQFYFYVVLSSVKGSRIFQEVELNVEVGNQCNIYINIGLL